MAAATATVSITVIAHDGTRCTIAIDANQHNKYTWQPMVFLNTMWTHSGIRYIPYPDYVPRSHNYTHRVECAINGTNCPLWLTDKQYTKYNRNPLTWLYRYGESNGFVVRDATVSTAPEAVARHRDERIAELEELVAKQAARIAELEGMVDALAPVAPPLYGEWD